MDKFKKGDKLRVLKDVEGCARTYFRKDQIVTVKQDQTNKRIAVKESQHHLYNSEVELLESQDDS